MEHNNSQRAGRLCRGVGSAAFFFLFLLFPVGNVPAQDNAVSFRFVVTGDSRSTNHRGNNWSSYINVPVLSSINKRILALDPRPAFIVFNGDLASRGGEELFRAWRKVMKPVTNAGIGLYKVVGNHETLTKKGEGDIDGQTAFQREFHHMPKNGPAGYEGLVYSFEFGNAFFAVLDTHWVEPDPPYRSHNYEIQEAQIAWLKEKLGKTHRTHKFVFAHAPAFSVQRSEGYAGYDQYKFPLWTVLDEHCVDIYFAGHEHLYARTKIDRNMPHPKDRPWINNVTQVITGSAGGPLVSGRGKADVIREEYNYAVVDVAGDSVCVRVFNEKGQALDSFSFVKSCSKAIK